VRAATDPYVLLELMWVLWLALTVSKEVPSASSREMPVLVAAVRLLTCRHRRYGSLHHWLP